MKLLLELKLTIEIAVPMKTLLSIILLYTHCFTRRKIEATWSWGTKYSTKKGVRGPLHLHATRQVSLSLSRTCSLVHGVRGPFTLTHYATTLSLSLSHFIFPELELGSQSSNRTEKSGPVVTDVALMILATRCTSTSLGPTTPNLDN